MKSSKMQVLITGCYKSGTDYTTQLLNNHPNFASILDVVQFMRFCFDRYNPIESKENYSKLIYDAAYRISLRTNYKVNIDKVLHHCNQVSKVNYALLYDAIFSDLFLTDAVHSWADKTQLVWTRVPDFLGMFPNGKVIHIVRDPRNVMASFKKSTYAPEPAYLSAVFNCYDSMKKGLFYRDNYDDKIFYLLKFEDLLLDTEKVICDIFEFLELSVNHDLLSQDPMIDVHGKPWFHNSSFMDPKDQTTKFDRQAATERWKINLEKEDITLCEAINGEVMDSYGYTSSGMSLPWDQMLKRVMSDENLTLHLQKWICEGKGIEAFPTDPLLSKNWGINNST